MDIRQVALVVSIVILVVSAGVYILSVRRHRAALSRWKEEVDKTATESGSITDESGYGLYAIDLHWRLKVPTPPSQTATAFLSLIVSILSFISSVVLGILQLLKH